MKSYLTWRVAKCNKVKWTKQSEVEWNEVQYRDGGGGRRFFMEKVYRSSKWWEVKDWGESVSELMIVKKQLQETVHSTVLLGSFYLLHML